MRSDDVVEVVVVEEGFGDVGAELNADAALRRRSTALRLRVRPKQIAHDTYGR